ncbi:hypothetical protein [Streptomyces sp. NPDC054958]
MAASPAISTSRTPPSGQASAVAEGEGGALRSGASLGVPLDAVGTGAALGAGGVEHPAVPVSTPASTPTVTRAGIRRLVRRFAIIR